MAPCSASCPADSTRQGTREPQGSTPHVPDCAAYDPATTEICMSTQPVILAAKRTPVGRFFGGLSKVPSPVLGSYAIQAVFAESPAIGAAGKGGQVDEVMMGCVLQAGLGQNPARQAAL